MGSPPPPDRPPAAPAGRRFAVVGGRSEREGDRHGARSGAGTSDAGDEGGGESSAGRGRPEGLAQALQRTFKTQLARAALARLRTAAARRSPDEPAAPPPASAATRAASRGSSGDAAPQRRGLPGLLRGLVPGGRGLRHRAAWAWPSVPWLLGPAGLGPHDEGTHRADGQRHFGESYTFACVQHELAIVVRLERLPGRDAQRVWVAVLRGDGEALVHPTMLASGSAALVRPASRDPWRGGGIALDCVHPHRTWSVQFTGPLVRAGGATARAAAEASPRAQRDEGGATAGAEPAVVHVAIDLQFEATAAPYVPGRDDDPEVLAGALGRAPWDRRLLRALSGADVGLGRSYVQLGACTGAVSLRAGGGTSEVIPLLATCLRQHEWGVIDWGAADGSWQALFPAHAGRPSAWLREATLPWIRVQGGFLADGARVTPIAALGSTAQREPGRAPRHMSVHAKGPPTRSAQPGATPRGAGATPGAHAVGEPVRSGVRWEAERVVDVAVHVDGRGQLTLALVQTGPRDAAGRSGWGLLASQSRVLPRRGAE